MPVLDAPVPGEASLLALLLSLAALFGGCTDRGPTDLPRPSEPTVSEATLASGTSHRAALIDRSEATGLDFVHFNGMSGELYMVEMVGSGVALLDYDRDGDLDVYLVQGAMLPGDAPSERALTPPTPDQQLGDRLFRNELTSRDGDGDLRFTDVTVEAGLHATGYGQGVATGDVDGDGWVDLYVTNYGANQLWRNRGDGTFVDITERSGTGDATWGTSATFLDYDRDGALDLYVANYLDATFSNHFQCQAATGLIDYCGPLSFAPLTDRLYRNLGDGRFEDVSQRSGILAVPGAGLGVVSADLDGDGWQDIYVANDQMPNVLWMNQRDGTFRDRAALAGVAVSGEGKAQASMGVDAADFDGDGVLDLLLTHLASETNTLYLSSAPGVFHDATPGSGLGPGSLPFTSFGTLGFDYDNDGWLDLLVANGTVRFLEEQRRAGEVLPLRQPDQLFRNLGGGRFVEVPASEAGGGLEVPRVSRGAAFGDLDNDGDTDVVVTHNNDRAHLLVNQLGQDSAWLGFRLEAEGLRRDPYGAEVRLLLPDGRILARRVHTDGSFLSAHDPRLLFGLGELRGPEAIEAVVVRWPDGSRERFDDLELASYGMLRQGEGLEMGDEEMGDDSL